MRSRPKTKKRAAAKNFEVKASLANSTLAKAKSALTLEIYSKKEKLGQLEIGRGSLFWWGAHRQIPKRIHWQRFSEMMDVLAYGKKRSQE